MFINVADMIRALQTLPADARIVVTQEGYYSYGEEFATCFLPTPAGTDNDGAPLFAVGHSSQNY